MVYEANDNSTNLVPEPIVSRRVLRVPIEFGRVDRGGWFFAQGRSPGQEQRIIRLFEENGFIIEHGGSFRKENPREMGIHACSYDNEGVRNRALAEAVGVRVPKPYQAREILGMDRAVVVKAFDANRGECKYLLETEEQKLKFITWALLGANVTKLSYEKDVETVIEYLFSCARHGEFSNPWFREKGQLGQYQFEEYIDVPGDRYASFRITADAFGEIHYGVLARSSESKGKFILPSARTKYPSLRQVTVPGESWDILLVNPDSPFYLGSKAFFSNIARGGKAIILDKSRIEDPVDRQVLIDHRINPNSPEIPKRMIDMASRIGRLSRGDYPYVGIDFLLSDKGELIFLEANKGPGLNPKAMGFPDASPEECQIEMMKRVITGMS